MGRSILILITFGILFIFGNAENLPDCDEFIEDAPFSVNILHETCQKKCPKDTKCFKNCIVHHVAKEGEDGQYLTYILSI